MNQNFDYSIVFPCLNCLNFTKRLIKSMISNEEDLSRVIAIDNGSTDDTRKYLKTTNIGKLICNKKNYGFGVPLNQGIMHAQTEWTILMNNDIEVSKDWIENLLLSAEENNLKVISPALIEEDLDYNLNKEAVKLSTKMDGYLRFGDVHAVCIAIHESVWDQVGMFRAKPPLFGFEDRIFFNDLDKNNIKYAITSKSWVHHYGSITQKSMKVGLGIDNRSTLIKVNKYDDLCQNVLLRKLKKIQKNRSRRKANKLEISKYGFSVMGRRQDGDFNWVY